MKHYLAKLALAGMLTASAVNAHDAVAPNDKEKCYGISKAGKNHCSSKANKHSCAGKNVTDNDANEWKFVKKGECKTLHGALAPKG